MKSIDGVFDWRDFMIHRMMERWKAEGISRPTWFHYCKSQPRLSNADAE